MFYKSIQQYPKAQAHAEGAAGIDWGSRGVAHWEGKNPLTQQVRIKSQPIDIASLSIHTGKSNPPAKSFSLGQSLCDFFS